MKNAARNGPTELEAAVLGVVWRDGPCTPYLIRRHFLESRAPRWSGSAGAIYPLIRRLETRGLVKSTLNLRGKRAQRDYRITRAGQAKLRIWLRSPGMSEDTSLIYDPLRTRMLFLAALPTEQARSFVAESVEQLRQELALLQKNGIRRRQHHICFTHLAARNAVLLTATRLKWLVEVEGELARHETA